jgi:hypothetical protein
MSESATGPYMSRLTSRDRATWVDQKSDPLDGRESHNDPANSGHTHSQYIVSASSTSRWGWHQPQCTGIAHVVNSWGRSYDLASQTSHSSSSPGYLTLDATKHVSHICIPLEHHLRVNSSWPLTFDRDGGEAGWEGKWEKGRGRQRKLRLACYLVLPGCGGLAH